MNVPRHALRSFPFVFSLVTGTALAAPPLLTHTLVTQAAFRGRRTQ
jgi:hypothetical protein